MVVIVTEKLASNTLNHVSQAFPITSAQTLQSRVSTLDRFGNCRRRFCKDTPPILSSNCKLIRAARGPVIYLLGGGVEALGEITWFSRGTEGDQLSPSENKGGGDCRKLSATEGA